MKLDETVSEAIRKACVDEGVSEAGNAVVRFVERYISNELPPQQYASTLQDIYETFKDSV